MRESYQLECSNLLYAVHVLVPKAASEAKLDMYIKKGSLRTNPTY